MYILEYTSILKLQNTLHIRTSTSITLIVYTTCICVYNKALLLGPVREYNYLHNILLYLCREKKQLKIYYRSLTSTVHKVNDESDISRIEHNNQSHWTATSTLQHPTLDFKLLKRCHALCDTNLFYSSA